MRSRQFRSDCSESRLSSFLDDRLPEPENARLADHLERCEDCRHTLERLAAGSRLWAELRELAPDFDPEPPVRPPVTETVHVPDPREALTADELNTLEFLAPPVTPGSLGRLGPYDVIEVLGRGGFGIVLKASDPALGRFVAIKVLASPLAANSAARGRFAREAKAAAAVVHENVVAIHAVDTWNGLPYLVMPCLSGLSLQKRVERDGPLAIKEILRVGMQAALGLAAAHDQGLVHRDVKPSNILLEEGVERVKLSDFGLARAVDDASLTQTGVIAGTPQYMSPEQARGEPVDHRSDLFGLGGVLYFMGAGHPPFRADSTPAVLRRVCDDRPRPLRDVNPDVPSWLAAIVDRLLAKEPGGRFATAAEVAEVLKQHLAALQGPEKPPARPPISPSPVRSRSIPIAASIVLGSAALLAGIGARGGLSGSDFALLSLGTDRTPNQLASAGPGNDEPTLVSFLGAKRAGGPIVGSGQLVSKTWEIIDFTEVTIDSTFRAEIVRGDAFKVTTTTDDNLVEHLRVSKEGKTLKIGLESDRQYRLKTPLQVQVVLPALTRLDVGGSSRAKLEGFRSDTEFKLRLHGASKVSGAIDVGSAEFQVDGSSNVDLSGSAKVARLSVNGASHLKLAQFLLKQCEIEALGASTAQLAVQSDRPFRAKLSGASTLEGAVDAGDVELLVEGASRLALRGSAQDAKIKAVGACHLDLTGLVLNARKVVLLASGASGVTLKGASEAATLQASGASQLRLAGLVVGEVKVQLSGASEASVDAQKSLQYQLSSGSRLDYAGEPSTLTGTKSSGATLRRRP
ncbi:serine/threonine protein kinase [Singulisphaera sp. GP187]|uniref:protein kinase domain-containing protein n=1 Tax=Singulisphaera sp. GP187 TaxID=1882752 RepID=UPI00092AFD44|nr:DUF2807 domain-containing protein [Singulisphaera sp. GP187]SIN74089.1 serine/threonine protein kinase [Singulisphaera sp. GP187]